MTEPSNKLLEQMMRERLRLELKARRKAFWKEAEEKKRLKKEARKKKSQK